MPRTRAGKGRRGEGNGTPPTAFDLGAHRMAARFDVPIVAPDGSATPMVVTLMSRYSVEFRARQMAAERAALDSASATKRPDTDAATAEAAIESFILDTVVSVTADWRGFVLDGETMDCTPANVRAIYTADGLGWVYQQVADAYLGRERFFARPGNAS